MHRIVVAAFAAVSSLAAQDLGGGAPASHGRVPRFVLDTWLPGALASLAFVDAPTATPAGAGILSAGRTAVNLPFLPGTLIADPALGVVVPMTQSLAVGLPAQLHGRSLYIQGVLLDGAGLLLTDATQVNFWRPLAVVGCQRQSANSLLLIDVATRTQVGRIGNSENGSIAISPDRGRMYVCEPGSVRNHVVVFDISVLPALRITTIINTGGVRYRGEFSPDGRLLYVPVHDGVDVIDTDRASATYHTVLRKINTPITGNATSIFTGPIDVAVTPDGRKLFIAYGQSGATFPGNGTLGVIDLTLPTFPHRSIPITLSGVVNLLGNLATHNAVRVSPDGQFVYVLEFGFQPGQFVSGFTNGSSVKIVDAVSEVEVAAIATRGVGQSEINLDLLGRNLWLAQVDLGGVGEVLRFDVDRRSATRNSLVAQPHRYGDLLGRQRAEQRGAHRRRQPGVGHGDRRRYAPDAGAGDDRCWQQHRDRHGNPAGESAAHGECAAVEISAVTAARLEPRRHRREAEHGVGAPRR